MTSDQDLTKGDHGTHGNDFLFKISTLLGETENFIIKHVNASNERALDEQRRVCPKHAVSKRGFDWFAFIAILMTFLLFVLLFVVQHSYFQQLIGAVKTVNADRLSLGEIHPELF